MSVSQIVAEGLYEGKSTSQMIVENPGVKPNSISVLASRVRKEMGIVGRTISGPPLQLTRDIHAGLEREALARGDRSANLLALRILTIIVKDDLFDAILGGAE